MGKGDRESTPQDKKKNTEAKQEHAVAGKLAGMRKKMGTITLVTPPSFFTNQNKSFCLVNLSKRDKDNFADNLNKFAPKEDVTIYLWDDNNFSNLDPFGNESDAEYEKYLETWKPNQKGRDYTWLLNACRTSTVVVMNMDYASNPMKVWAGYILTMAKTYFVNSNEDEANALGVLNRNRIRGMHELFPKIQKNISDR